MSETILDVEMQAVEVDAQRHQHTRGKVSSELPSLDEIQLEYL